MGVLYLGRDDGWLVASNVFTGKVLWQRRFGSIPDQPAIWEGKLYFGTFDRPGSVYAVDAKTGHVIWRRQLTDQVESSMVVVDGRVFTGCNDGTVRALNALTGKVMWQFRAAGAVKDSLAVDGGRVFFGAYGGTMYSLRASDGKVLWDTHTSGLSGGFRSGNFYSSPAVAYGRVYIGNTDGKVYSFVAGTGQVAWTSTFPDWAYGSPGVASRRRVLDQLRRHGGGDERAHRRAPVDAQAAVPVAVARRRSSGTWCTSPTWARRPGRATCTRSIRGPAPSAGTSTTASTTGRSSPPAG